MLPLPFFQMEIFQLNYLLLNPSDGSQKDAMPPRPLDFPVGSMQSSLSDPYLDRSASKGPSQAHSGEVKSYVADAFVAQKSQEYHTLANYIAPRLSAQLPFSTPSTPFPALNLPGKSKCYSASPSVSSSSTGTITEEGRLDASRITSPATKERARTATAPIEFKMERFEMMLILFLIQLFTLKFYNLVNCLLLNPPMVINFLYQQKVMRFSYLSGPAIETLLTPSLFL